MFVTATTLERVDLFGGIAYTGTPSCYVVGAGSRGAGYVGIAIEDPDSLSVVGVAEPVINCLL